MGGYGSGRPTKHLSTSDCHIIGVKDAGDYGVELTYTEQCGAVPGRRAWMVAPCCKRRVGKLYIRPGHSNLSCRTCLQLNYDSQRLTLGEKQRTYECWLLEQGYLWAYVEWLQLRVHYLSKEEAEYYMGIGQCRRTSEFIKLMIEHIKLMATMQRHEEKRKRYEQKALEAEKKCKKYSKKKKPSIYEIHADMDAVQELIAA